MYGQWKKAISITLSIILSFGVIQIPVFAEEETAPEEEIILEKVETEEQEEESVFEEITEDTEEEPAVEAEVISEITPEETVVLPEITEEETIIKETEELPEETELPETIEGDPEEALPQDDVSTPEIDEKSYEYNDYSKVLTVYQIGEDYTSNSLPEWYDLRGKVKKVVFEGDALDAERIGDFSFYFFSSLQEITLPPNLKEIGYEAFYYTNKLKTLVLPDTLEVLGDYALGGIGAARIDLPASIKSIANTAFNFSDLKDIYYAGTYEQWQAFNCNSHDANIHTSDFEELRVQNVTFEMPKSKIPVGSTMQIKTVVQPENAFSQQVKYWSYWPENIVSIDSSGILTAMNTGKVTVYGNVDPYRDSEYCRKSGSFTIEVINNSGKAGKLEWAYENKILTVNGNGAVPDYSATEAPWSAFADEVETVVLGDAVSSIGAGAFKNTKALKAVTLPESVKEVGASAFEGSGVETVTLSPAVKTIGADAFKDTPLKEVYFTGSEEEWNTIDIQDETLLSDSVLVYKELVSVTGLKLSDVSKIVYDLEETFQLIPEIQPENATFSLVRFSSDNEAVATVTDVGDVFLHGYGTAVITVASVQNPSVYETCMITVREAKEIGAVTADVEPGTVDAGTIVTLNAEPEDAQIWYSLDGATVPSPEAENCFLYSEPLSITIDTVIMARAFKDGYTTGETVYTFVYTMKTAEQLIENEEDYKRYLELDDEAKKGIWVNGMPYEEDIVYTGSPIQFDLRVYEGTKLLETGKDYKVTYKNNTKAYTGSLLEKKAPVVTLTGLGGYNFTLNCQFRIYPKDIGDDSGDIVIKEIYAPYSNKKQNPVPEITHVSGNRTLKYNTDFTIDEYQNKNGLQGSGTYTLTLHGKGNYTGTAEGIAVIVEPAQVSVSKLKFSKISACTFDPFAENYECTPKVTVKNGKTTLTESTDGVTGDYKVTYLNNKKPGTATAVIEGIGEQYKGSKKITFKINAVALSKATITLEQTKFTYNLHSHKITAKVVFKNKAGQSVTLKEGTHYTVSRKEVTDAGKYTIQFKAVNGSGFTGTVKKTVTVNKLSAKSSNRIKIVNMDGDPRAPYSKYGATLNIRVIYYTGDNPDGNEYLNYINDPSICIPLVEGKDYKITYKNNKTVSTKGGSPASAVITLLGNYSGSLSYTFYVYAGEAVNMSLFASDKAYTGKVGDFKVTPVVYDGSKALKAGTDYQKLVLTSYYYEYDTELENGIVRAAGSKVELFDDVPSGTTIRVNMKFQLKGKYVSSSYNVLGMSVPYTELSTTYRIVRGSLSKATCTFSYHGKFLAAPNDYYYTGHSIEPGKDSMEVVVNGRILSSSDYRIIAYKNNVNPSDVQKKQYASVLIEGTGNYTGRAELKFTIVRMAYVVTTWDTILEIFGYKRYDNIAVPTL